MNSFSKKIQEAVQRRPWTVVLLLFAASLTPFCGKPVHLDDPIFLWTAQQIQAAPLNPYGAEINWDGWSTPLHWINLNPPLTSYYLAIWGTLFGYQEVVLHLAYMVPAMFLALAVYRLAEKFCSRPQEAALVCLWSPVVLLSATTLMCDITMLCFWCWAILFFIEAVERNRIGLYFGAGALISLSALSKYFGITLVPLLVAYAILKKAHKGRTFLAMMIPIGTMALYFYVTEKLYGHSLLEHAQNYSAQLRELTDQRIWVQLLKGLVLLGGCCLGVLFYLRSIWSVRNIALVLFAVAGLWLTLDLIGQTGPFSGKVAEGAIPRGLFWTQMTLALLSGLVLFSLLPVEAIRSRHPETVLLVLWILGTFVFSVFINWTMNGRTMLGIALPFGLLLFQKLEAKGPPSERALTRFGPLAMMLGLSLLICQSDYLWASSARAVARDYGARFAHPNRTVWFHGHWGFQWYLEALNAQAVDVSKSVLLPGDVLIVAHDNSMPWRTLEEGALVLTEEHLVPTGWGLGLMNRKMGAGFYSTFWGPLPFVIGPVPRDRYQVFMSLRRLPVNKKDR